MAVEILTYLLPVEAGHEQPLRSTLETFERGTSPFVQVPGTHVARFVVINWLGTGDPTNRRRLRPARLLFSAVVDGPEEGWLFGLIAKQGTTLEEVWRHCSGWSAEPREAWTPWLLEYRLTPSHQVVAHDATVAEIRRGLALQRAMAQLKFEACDLKAGDLRAAYKDAMAEVGR
jgi:hypothetical protein